MKRPSINDPRPHANPIGYRPNGNNNTSTSADTDKPIDIDPVIHACIMQLFHDPEETLDAYCEDQ